MDELNLPPCPWCNTPKHVQQGGSLRTWWCRKCCREFDDSDDGEVGYGRPDRIVERREERKIKESKRERNKRVTEMWR